MSSTTPIMCLNICLFLNQFKIYKSKKINSNKEINKNLIPRFEKLVEWLMKKWVTFKNIFLLEKVDNY